MPEVWPITASDHTFDVVKLAQQIYCGCLAKETHMPLPRSRRWAEWIFSLEDVWKEDADMSDRPLVVHCSGLGGGLLSPDHTYDLFFQNHAQTKVYGPSLAMIDNWELRVSQLGLTKTTHEYVIYQLLATACGWSVWRNFLPNQVVNPKLLLTRAVRLLRAATIRPAHVKPPHPTWITAVRQIIRCYHPQGKILLLQACYPDMMKLMVPNGARQVDVCGFSAGSYTGLAVHSVLSDFACFPGDTKVAAIAAPPELMRLATGERKVTLIHCVEDRLCVWRPADPTELGCNLILLEGSPGWLGRAKNAYGHLLFVDLDEGTHRFGQLQITHPNVIPHGIRCEGLLRVLSWVSFDLPDHFKRTLDTLLKAAGEGCMELHTVAIEGKDVRDHVIGTELDLQQALIKMIPIPGGAGEDGGQIIRNLLVEFLSGFSLRALIFLLDMVLPQLDAYHTGRRIQHLEPWISVALAQSHAQGQSGMRLTATYQYEAYAGFHALTLHTDSAPLLLFADPTALPQCSPWQLCEAGNLGSMESNVMAGRALLGRFQLPTGHDRHAIFLVIDKTMQGSNKNAAYRAYRRIAPKSVEVILLPHFVARTFCGRLIEKHAHNTEYFDPGRGWPHPIEGHVNIPLDLQQLSFLGDTRSRRELLVFAQANPSRLPLAMGISQPGIPVRRMAADRKTKVTDALVRILRRFLTPATITIEGQHDQYHREVLL